MDKYRILIVDDNYHNNKDYYEYFFEDQKIFISKAVETRKEFESNDFRNFDAVFLDVNLDEPAWDMSLSDAIQVVGKQCPIMLVSFQWDEDKTFIRIEEMLSLAKDVNIIQTMSLTELSEEGKEKKVKMLRLATRIAISQHRRQAGLTVGEMDEINFLHLSDTQYGDPNTDDWSYLIEHRIPKFVRQRKKIHFLVVTGDIVYSGKPPEYTLAEKKLSALINNLWPNNKDARERILFVPGNHDVNFNLASADYVTYKITEKKFSYPRIIKEKKIEEQIFRKYRMQPFRDFAYSFTNDKRWLDSENLCWINDSFRHLGLRFYILNSASEINCEKPTIVNIPESDTWKFTDVPEHGC